MKYNHEPVIAFLDGGLLALKEYPHEPVARILICLAAHKGRVLACELSGVSYEQFSKWMDGIIPLDFIGQNREFLGKVKHEFVEAIIKAEHIGLHTGREKAEQVVFAAMEKGIWQAGAWYLERRFPQQYGLRQPQPIDTAKTVIEDIKKDLGIDEQSLADSQSVPVVEPEGTREDPLPVPTGDSPGNIPGGSS